MNKWETNSSNEELAKTINNNNKFKEGDVLKASDLNSIVGATLKVASDISVNKTINDLLISKYFRDMMSTTSSKSWNKANTSMATYTIKWNNIPLKLYVVATIDTDLINCTVLESNTYISVKFDETSDLKDVSTTATTKYEFNINFYLDQEHTKLMYTYKDEITYYYQSTTPSGD